MTTLPFRTPAAAICAALLCVSPAIGAIKNVSTASQLRNAVNSAMTGDEIVVAPGTYNLPVTLIIDVPGVTLRGATGNRDDVILRGGGVNNNVEPRTNIFVSNRDITIQDLTVSESYYNGIHLKGETNLVHNTLISNVRVENIGERYIKGSRFNSSNPNIVDAVTDLTIEDSYLVQTTPYVQHPGQLNDYIGGIDVMTTKNAVIRNNVFENIGGEDGEGRGALFLWQGNENTLVENNVFLNNDRSIALGNPGSLPATQNGTYDIDGAIVRNNTVVRPPVSDVGVELWYSKDLQFYNNTLYGAFSNQFRTLSIGDRTPNGSSLAATTGLDIQNNIIRGNILDSAAGNWSAAEIAALGNVVHNSGSTVLSTWFEDVSAGDLHLTELGAQASGLTNRLADASFDLDGDARFALTNYGADQSATIVPEPSAAVLAVLWCAAAIVPSRLRRTRG